MHNNIKTMLDFSALSDIDNIIEDWAENAGFIEINLPRYLSSDDVTYCFSQKDEYSRTLLTINILDGIVHLETWTEANIKINGVLKTSINDLLIKLNQSSIK